MPSNRRLELTAEAEADIREIIQYTGETWGPDQRDIYARILDAAMQRLIAFPLSGKTRTDISRGLRSQTAGKHKVFYRVTEETISIRRVIHARRDVTEDDVP